MAAAHSALFVCLGNICRSVAAEAIFKDLVGKRNVQDEWVLIDSAATSTYEIGSLPDDRGLEVLKEKAGLTSSHRARQIKQEDYDKFEYIFGFDTSNMDNLRRMAPKGPYRAKLVLLGTYDSQGGDIIEDPYYHGKKEFVEVFGQCKRSLESFLDEIYNKK